MELAHIINLFQFSAAACRDGAWIIAHSDELDMGT